eukprot:COSAG05_NODE_2519_length_2950_cov_72.884602_4_plen_55_part_00
MLYDTFDPKVNANMTPDAPYEFLVDGNWVQRTFLGSDPAASVANYMYKMARIDL